MQSLAYHSIALLALVIFVPECQQQSQITIYCIMQALCQPVECVNFSAEGLDPALQQYNLADVDATGWSGSRGGRKACMRGLT